MKKNPFYKFLGNEDKLQNSVITYLRAKYNVLAIPLNTESNKTPFERYKSKYLGLHKGIPDLFIPTPRRGFNGLFLELKAEGKNVYKKNGELLKNTHLEIQAKYHKKLNQAGFYACFGVGAKNTFKIIDWYFKNK